MEEKEEKRRVSEKTENTHKKLKGITMEFRGIETFKK